MVVLVGLRACAALLDMCSHNAIASDAIGRERASRRPGSREQAGRLLSATGFLDQLSLHRSAPGYVHNLKLNIFHIAKPGLNAAKPGTVSHDEPEKVKAVI